MPATETVTIESQLSAAQKELRDMQRAIVALRGELELAHVRREQEVQQTLAAGQDEIKLLKATAASLRDALEQAAIAKDAQVQAGLDDQRFKARWKLHRASLPGGPRVCNATNQYSE